MASKAFIEPAIALRPVRMAREDELVKVHYLDTGTEFILDADKPVHIMHSVTANDDNTTVEVCDSKVLAVQQVTEDGETQTLMLSPRMAIELARLIDSFVVFPIGINAE